MGQKLWLNSFEGRNVSIVIYWHPKEGPDALQNGHASLIIYTTRFKPNETDYYVSWMAGGGGRNPFKQRAQPATFLEDMQQWGGFPTGHGNLPTRWVALDGLDVLAMKTERDRIRERQGAHWKLFDKNCATCVARVLKAGGGDQYATKAKNQLIWWSTDLITYARSMGDKFYRRSDVMTADG